jgi:hypothetical protein
MVNVERIKAGNRQTIDTLLSEEALLFGKYTPPIKADIFDYN